MNLLSCQFSSFWRFGNSQAVTWVTPGAVWWVSLEVLYQLTAVLNFGILKRIHTPHSLLNFILGFWSRLYLYNPFVRRQSSSLSPSSSPCTGACSSSDNHSRRLFQKTIESFDCNINGQARVSRQGLQGHPLSVEIGLLANVPALRGCQRVSRAHPGPVLLLCTQLDSSLNFSRTQRAQSCSAGVFLGVQSSRSPPESRANMRFRKASCRERTGITEQI